ncbi:BRO family protein [Oceanobacillus sp. FSL W7-1281]|uniref:BRO family protein n=1 Tax=Oceanobacillus sp. FSL W7-1281 TaxID=2921698 RepID=UPI0030D78B88
MNKLTKMFEGNQLRIIEQNNEPWFVANDVCKILDIKNTTQAVAKLDNDERSMFNIGRQGNTNLINEYGLYNLVLGSRKPEAKQFKRWVTHEVIPSIRKTGSYQVGQNDLVTNYLSMSEEDRAIAFFNSQKEKKQIEQQRQEELPYTNFGKAVSNSSAAINIGAFSKLMYDEHGIKLGRNKMFQWLRDNGFLIKSGRERNQPKQQFIEQGLFTTTVTMVSRTEGDVESVTTLVTGKGQIKLSNKLISEFSTLNQRGVI